MKIKNEVKRILENVEHNRDDDYRLIANIWAKDMREKNIDLTTINELMEGVGKDKAISYEKFQDLLGYTPQGITDKDTLLKALQGTTLTNMPVTAVPQTYEEFMLTQRNNPTLFSKGDVGNFWNQPKPKNLVNPKTGSYYTNPEWDALKTEIIQDRGYSTGGDDGPQDQDPCKGPNPPAYCFTGGKKKDEEAEEAEE